MRKENISIIILCFVLFLSILSGTNCSYQGSSVWYFQPYWASNGEIFCFKQRRLETTRVILFPLWYTSWPVTTECELLLLRMQANGSVKKAVKLPIDMGFYAWRDILGGISWNSWNKKLVFGLSGRIYTINNDGSNFKELLSGKYPDWSPDGTKLAYIDDTNSIVVADTNGTKLYSVSPVPTPGSVEWSPDSQKFVFETTGGEIYIINTDGTGLQQVSISSWGSYPIWSNDGIWIYYVTPNGITKVYPDGTNETPLVVVSTNSSFFYTYFLNAHWLSPQEDAFVVEKDKSILVNKFDGSSYFLLTQKEY